MADEKDPKASADKSTAADPAKPADAAADGKKKGGKPKLALPDFKPREKLFLRIFLFSFALLSVDLVLIHPIGSYLRRLDETIRMKEEVIPKRLLIWKYKDKIIKDYRSVKSFLIDPALSQEEEMAQFLREIERVSKEARFFVSNINPVKINKKSDNVYELSLDVDGKGGLKEVRDFMNIIESSNPSIRVSAFNLKPQTKEAAELKVTFSIVKLGVKKNHSTVVS